MPAGEEVVAIMMWVMILGVRRSDSESESMKPETWSSPSQQRKTPRLCGA
jgi:hypothetical protein